MDLKRQNELLEAFKSWFESAGPGSGSSLKATIEDNRRRYRMQLSDKDKARKKRDLSALPATKSRSITDGISDNFIVDYHQDPDALSFTSTLPGMEDEQKARFLTNLFLFRAQNTFPFYPWHEQSIKAGLVDGVEAVFASWKRESYKEKTGNILHFYDNGTERQQVTPEVEELGKAAGLAGTFTTEEEEQEVVVTDTFWYDKLVLGENVFIDPKAPFMNVNRGSFCLVYREMSLDEIKAFREKGIFDKLKDKDLTEFQAIHEAQAKDSGKIAADPDTIDLQDLNKILVWIFFSRKNFKWSVDFSIEGKKVLSSTKGVNDVFFNGRPVHRLPVVVGYNRSNIHENIGAGIPFLTASHEDEWNNNRNDIADAARRSLQDKWRIDRGAEVNIDQLLNSPAFYADQGEVEQLPSPVNILQAQRSNDSIMQEIVEMVPTSIANRGRSVVPRGTTSTLGANQMMDQDSNTKRSNQMQLRNETFLKPLMAITAELLLAYESDQKVLTAAGKAAGIMPPVVTTAEGKQLFDLSWIEFPYAISINAGLGSIPRSQKAQNLIQVTEWRLKAGVPTDVMNVAQQLNTLVGFDKDQFTPKEPPAPPQPPPVEYKVKTDIPFMMLPPEAQKVIIQKMLEGGADVEADIKADPAVNLMMQNGGMGAPPDRAAMPMVDATGAAGEGMSQGGQYGAE